jgi:hypothetical protein
MSPPAEEVVKLGLATLLRECSAKDIGISPDHIPSWVQTSLPLSLVRPQLASRRVNLRLSDIVNGLDKEMRHLIVPTKLDLDVTVPANDIFHALPVTAQSIGSAASAPPSPEPAAPESKLVPEPPGPEVKLPAGVPWPFEKKVAGVAEAKSEELPRDAAPMPPVPAPEAPVAVAPPAPEVKPEAPKAEAKPEPVKLEAEKPDTAKPEAAKPEPLAAQPAPVTSAPALPPKPLFQEFTPAPAPVPAPAPTPAPAAVVIPSEPPPSISALPAPVPSAPEPEPAPAPALKPELAVAVLPPPPVSASGSTASPAFPAIVPASASSLPPAPKPKPEPDPIPVPPPPASLVPKLTKPVRDTRDADKHRQMLLRVLLGSQDEDFDANAVVRLTTGQPGVAAAVCFLRGKPVARSGNGSPEAENFLNQAHRMHEHVQPLVELTGISDTETVSIKSDRHVVTFSLQGDVTLAVLHDPLRQEPTLREKVTLIARELTGLLQAA